MAAQRGCGGVLVSAQGGGHSKDSTLLRASSQRQATNRTRDISGKPGSAIAHEDTTLRCVGRSTIAANGSKRARSKSNRRRGTRQTSCSDIFAPAQAFRRGFSSTSPRPFSGDVPRRCGEAKHAEVYADFLKGKRGIDALYRRAISATIFFPPPEAFASVSRSFRISSQRGLSGPSGCSLLPGQDRIPSQCS